MDAQDKGKGRHAQAAAVLHRLDAIGAIKLDVLVAKSNEIQTIVGSGGAASFDDDGHQICYPFYIRIGPRDEFDLVSVATQLRALGFELGRVNTQTHG